MSILRDGQKSIRIILPKALYDRLKKECVDHGDISKLIRKLLLRHLESLKEI
jgi:hypothetical protein